jgi:hypothetical protein
MRSRTRGWERRTLCRCPSRSILRLQRAAKHSRGGARDGLRRGRRRSCVGHRRKDLMLRVRCIMCTVLNLTVLFVLGAGEVGQRATGGRTKGNWGSISVVIRKEAAWAMYRAGNARSYRLVDGDRTCAAVVRSSLVPVARVSLSFAFALTVSFSFLVPSSHLFVLLDCPVSLVHFAISIVS